MIQITLYTYRFMEKGAASSSELLIYFKYNNHIQERKLVLEEQNMDEMITQQQGKSNNPFSSFFKPCRTLIWNFSLFLRASESRGKSRARNVGEFLSALDAVGTKLENFRPSTNKLEEIPCVFFVEVIYETRKTMFLLLFSNSFSIGIMFNNFFIERCHKHYTLGDCGGFSSQKKYVHIVRGGGGSLKADMCVQGETSVSAYVWFSR